jgi:U3 small nucleolar RNA-associated protein 14
LNRFRRLVRKDRQKQEEKNLEKLAVENPDQFLERLQQLERRRIEERSTLRHKNSTKWAKEKRLLSKFNTKVNDTKLFSIRHCFVFFRYVRILKNN